MTPTVQAGPFERLLARLAAGNAPLLKRLARLEARFYREDLEAVAVEAPIYVVGLPRAGTTVVLELLSSHPQTASHKYRDFPFVLTPLWWNGFLDLLPRGGAAPAERAHGDGIVVGPESPEALEEMVWMAHGGAATVGGRLDAAFAAAYSDHIRKVLLLRRGCRYLAKNNTSVARLPLLAAMFPEARIVLVVRDPVAQVASLLRQHLRFCEAGRRDPRVPEAMSQAGHFEFGLDRRPVHCSPGAAQGAMEAWAAGDEVLGWARYWRAVYGEAAATLARDPAVRRATLVIRHEDLVENPRTSLRGIFDHCRLDLSREDGETLASRLRPARRPDDMLSEGERRRVMAETAAVAAAFGY